MNPPPNPIPKDINNGDKELNKHIFKQVFDGTKNKKLQDILINRCANCWLLVTNCICNQISKIQLTHEYLICFHPTEWTRSTNTGRLIVLSENINDNPSPLAGDKVTVNDTVFNNQESSHAKLFVLGEYKDEEQLDNILQSRSKETTIVLFPSQNSINIKDYLQKFDINVNIKNNTNSIKISNDIQEGNNTTTTTTNTDNNNNNNDNNKDSTESISDNTNNIGEESTDITTISETLNNIEVTKSDNNTIKFTIIILDGTWRQAKTLNKRIPQEYTRVHLEFGLLKFRSLYNSLRTQPQVDRVSTLEASILSMKYFNESDENLEKLIETLKLLVRKVLQQSQKITKLENSPWVGNKRVVKRNIFQNNNDADHDPENKE
ncbi:hypothetical protein DLAC_09292 [Tieghemostelium lacteum]|uniref:tRNA-uridine aminocarboxypropyltransferase n=1 Tax=Tieghemostelium lacteum TaxID=361077 RepID=A0A151Z9N8_TIELA|nr:hypothetical protein DLAC_09292 [Tieghemostelium lacteum]|eukprot:KYQ90658.1 hypothetical protein DLAC_09292 [Tieghemostelium lacteum]